MILRELEINDYHKGFLNLLNQLFNIEIILTKQEFINNLLEIQMQNSYIYVIEEDNRLVATGKIIIEQKIHGATVGHIENVVCNSSYRNRGFGKKIVNKLIEIGSKNNCYKVVLNCNSNNISFYEKTGMTVKGTEMVVYLN